MPKPTKSIPAPPQEPPTAEAQRLRKVIANLRGELYALVGEVEAGGLRALPDLARDARAKLATPEFGRADEPEAPASDAPTWRLTVPLRTRSGLNNREHWRARAARVKQERTVIKLAMRPVMTWERWRSVPPCTVTLTRISPGTLDSDNLQGSLKGVRDQVAEVLGLDDRDPRITWVYRQEKAAKRGGYAVWVEIAEVRAAEPDLEPVEPSGTEPYLPSPNPPPSLTAYSICQPDCPSCEGLADGVGCGCALGCHDDTRSTP